MRLHSLTMHFALYMHNNGTQLSVLESKSDPLIMSIREEGCIVTWPLSFPRYPLQK